MQFLELFDLSDYIRKHPPVSGWVKRSGVSAPTIDRVINQRVEPKYETYRALLRAVAAHRADKRAKRAA
jgi:predicted transcriptional regulator